MNDDTTPVRFIRPSDNDGSSVDLIRLTDADNVGVALRDIKQNESVESITTVEEIPKGHKVALKNISSGEAVKKYDQIIGYASTRVVLQSIARGRSYRTLERRHRDSG